MKSTTKALLLALAAGPASMLMADPVQIAVTAAAETAPTDGDADDPAIWVNPADPAASLIIGTDKTAGLYVYDLTGAQVAFLPDGALNNVDLRPFPGFGDGAALVAATRRDDDTIAFYILDAAGLRQAEPWTFPAIPPGVAGVDDIYGFAMGQDAGGLYAIANFKSGHVVQWRVTASGGVLALDLARVFTVGSQPEGMVADDVAGHLYVGEEDVGIWRVPLAPDQPADPVQIAAIPSDCLPVDDVEGLAIHDGDPRMLVASAQGIHRAALFALDGDAVPACVGLVEIAAGDVDGVTETDGLDVTALPVGPNFPQGLLVMMDDQNAGFTTNFKLIGWDGIAAMLD